MRNIILVIKHEILTTIQKPSFWLMTILFPVFILGLNLGTQLMTSRTIEETEAANPSGKTDGAGLGYVDEAGLMNSIPAEVPAGFLVGFPSQETAEAALRQGEIESFVLIPENYLETGSLIITQREFSPLGATREDIFEYIINYNLTGNADLTAALANPLANVRGQRLAPTDEGVSGGGTGPLASLVPYAVMFIFFFLITMGGGYMLQSVSREKENRTAEVLLLSLNPRQLMLGKILGLSAVALLQMAIWVGGGMLLLGNIGRFLESVDSFDFPNGFIFYAVLYFLLGYLMYASLLGAAGALAPSARETGHLTFIIMLPMMIPLWFNQAILTDPNGTLSSVLSLIPFTAPAAMLTRLASGVVVPLWQILASLGGLGITAYLMVLLAARFFRADTLLTMTPITRERILAVLRRQVSMANPEENNLV